MVKFSNLIYSGFLLLVLYLFSLEYDIFMCLRSMLLLIAFPWINVITTRRIMMILSNMIHLTRDKFRSCSSWYLAFFIRYKVLFVFLVCSCYSDSLLIALLLILLLSLLLMLLLILNVFSSLESVFR